MSEATHPNAAESGSGYRWIGQSMKRVEDPRLLTGRGKYIDDVILPNMAHAAVLRSPHAHARIKSIDTSRAEALPGVVLVMTGAQAAEQTGPLPCFSNPPVAQHCIATDRVRHVGETVAAVVAESRYIAEDAVDLIDVEYELLPAVVDPEDAITSSGDAVLHPERGPNNIALQRTLGFGDVEDDFAAADRVIRRKMRWPRSGGQPMETVGAIAEYDEGMGKFTIHANISMYNYVGWLIAVSLGVPAHRLNIVPVIAGGSFGSKLFAHKPPVLAATLARAAGRPVKYLEDRIDNITSCDNHGSDRIYDMEVAVMDDGTITSLRMKVIDDYGAYLQFGVGHHGNAAAQLTGPYRIGSGEIALTAVLTNKCQQGAYRGFGSEVTNFVLERMVDAAAEELGMDPAEIRRRNFIRPDQFPYKIPTGNVYDSGDYESVLDKALEMVDYQGWRKRQEEARREGRHIGIGLVTCQERSVFSSTEFWFWNDEPGFALTSSPESVNLKIDPTGKAFVTLHAPFWGNSPETMATQIVAEHLTMTPDDIHVTYSDTDHGLNGTGPGGSRYTVMIAGAIAGASTKIKSKMMRVASHFLEAAEEDLELVDGSVRIQGSDRAMSIPEIALQAHYFRAQPARRRGQRAGCEPRLRPPLHHHAERGPERSRRLLSDHGAHVSHPGDRGRRGDGANRVPGLRGGARLRHRGQPHDAGGSRARGDGAGDRLGRLRALPLRRGRPAPRRDLRRLPDPDAEGGAREHPGRPRGDAVAVHGVRHQGRRRGRPDGRAASDRGGGGGCAAAVGGQGRCAADHADAGAGVDSGGDGRHVVMTP